jgi:hypothetical protein
MSPASGSGRTMQDWDDNIDSALWEANTTALRSSSFVYFLSNARCGLSESRMDHHGNCEVDGVTRMITTETLTSFHPLSQQETPSHQTEDVLGRYFWCFPCYWAKVLGDTLPPPFFAPAKENGLKSLKENDFCFVIQVNPGLRPSIF